MSENSKLNDMLDDLINQKPENAQVNFHDYLQGKMREVMGNVPSEVAKDSDQQDNEEN